MTATYAIQYASIIKNHVTVCTLTANEVELGTTVTVSGSTAPFNGPHTVYALPQYLLVDVDSNGLPIYDYSIPISNAIQWIDTQDDQTFHAHTGSVSYDLTCTWVTSSQVMAYLGVTIDNPSDDYTLLTQATSASNAFCFRRRSESGYDGDSLSTSPGGDVTLGTLMYAAALWRARGSVQDTFATFDNMGGSGTQAMTPIIKQLLGISRPQVA